MVWTDIPNSAIDADSPITEELLTALRDNPGAMAEGDSSAAPRVTTMALSLKQVIELTSSGNFDPAPYAAFPSAYIKFLLWGGGGAGARNSGSGVHAVGGGGARCFVVTVKISKIVGLIPYQVGAGAAGRSTNGTGAAGGDTTVTINGVEFSSTGAEGGSTSLVVAALGGGIKLGGTEVANSRLFNCDPHYAGGWSVQAATYNGAPPTLHGSGAGGISMQSFPGLGNQKGISFGDGADGGDGATNVVAAEDGSVPGGGGGGTAFGGTSGSGGDGLIRVEVWGIR